MEIKKIMIKAAVSLSQKRMIMKMLFVSLVLKQKSHRKQEH
jgi:hypothetical protein